MKKIIFLQIKGNSFGGIWQVNKTLGNEFCNQGFDVKLYSVRSAGNEMDKANFEQITINNIDKWEILRKKDVLNSFKNGNFLKTSYKYFKQKNLLKKDYKKMKKKLLEENPDYIIASHYQTLMGIPKKMLKRTLHVQHSTVSVMKDDKKNYKVLKKYNKKLYALIWLCKTTCDSAQKKGFVNNRYIYNPCRIENNSVPLISKNKKFIVLSRFSEEKRIDLLVKLVNEVFQNKKFKDWTFELYGKGSLNKETENIIKKSKQIFYKGVVDNPKEVLLKSSASLSTSRLEGFPLSIIESLSCGIPAIICDYGESATELIKDGFNGYVVKQNDFEGFKEKLIEFMEKEDLDEMAKKAFFSSKKFNTKEVVSAWKKLFKEMDGE